MFMCSPFTISSLEWTLWLSFLKLWIGLELFWSCMENKMHLFDILKTLLSCGLLGFGILTYISVLLASSFIFLCGLGFRYFWLFQMQLWLAPLRPWWCQTCSHTFLEWFILSGAIKVMHYVSVLFCPTGAEKGHHSQGAGARLWGEAFQRYHWRGRERIWQREWFLQRTQLPHHQRVWLAPFECIVHHFKLGNKNTVSSE